MRASPLGAWTIGRPAVVLLIAVAVTVFSGALALRLELETDLSALLPPDHPSVLALAELRDRVGAESWLAVIIESPSFAASRRFADDLVSTALAMRRPGSGEPYFTHAEYRRDVDFLADHALYFATTEELDRIEEELRYAVARARFAERRSLGNLQRMQAARPRGDSVSDILTSPLATLLVSPYPVSADSTLLIPRFAVAGSQSDFGLVEGAIEDLTALIDRLDPSAYHPAMQVGLGDRVARQLIEVRAILDDVRRSLFVGVTIVLLIVMSYVGWRSRRPGRSTLDLVVGLPLTVGVLGLPLVMSLVWTFGFAYLVVGKLNLFTSTLGLVLFGLGIDYGVHLYARYMEEREGAADRATAMAETYRAMRGPIALSAGTTAAPFFVLLAADFRGFSELGLIGGVGVLFASLATLTVLPALIMVLPDRQPSRSASRLGREPGGAIRRVGLWRSRLIALAGVLVVVISPVWVTATEFEYEFSKLEPRYPDYEAVNRKLRAVHARRGNPPAFVLVNNAEEGAVVAATLRRLAGADSASPTIERVETLHDRLPLTEEEQARKLARITTIRALAHDPLLLVQSGPELEALRRAASSEAPVPLEAVPQSVARTLVGHGGAVGQVVLVYPSVDVSDGRASMAFAEDVGEFTDDNGRVFNGASTSIVAAAMLQTMRRESPVMIALAFAAIIVLMVTAFRSVGWATLALVPLVAGMAVMVGLFVLFDLRLNFYNLAAIPAILGIGNDCGVHLVSRYREEGPGSSARILHSVGVPVAVGGLTTMASFSGLLWTSHPGLASIGQVAAVGVGAVLLTSLLLQPAMFRLIEGP